MQSDAPARCIIQPLPMGDELGCLPGKDKVFRCALGPAANRVLGRGPIKHAVEFGGWELPRVKFEMATRRQVFREERSSPGPITPPRRADENLLVRSAIATHFHRNFMVHG